MLDEDKPLNKQDQKRLKDKRGEGNGKTYIPFSQVGDFSSSGESVRVKSTTVGRLHHFHSGIELAAFLIFDWYTTTSDIREQFPIPLQDSLIICRQLGIKHPQTKGKLTIASTDLLLDLKGGNQLAIAVKPAEALNDKRVLEKLQIEKSYWENKGVKWQLFTEKEVSDGLKENLKWLKPFLDKNISDAYEIIGIDVFNLADRFSKFPNNKVAKFCGQLDDQYQLQPGHHVEILRFAVAHRYLLVDINKPFYSWKCAEVTLNGKFNQKREFGDAS
jgi:hypothetical protein